MSKNNFKATNWNAIEDKMDKMTYEKLCEQFWLSSRMPVSKDIQDWNMMSDVEKRLVERVFGGLTLLDTLQSEVGVDVLKPYARTPHELAVLNNIGFMEALVGDTELLTVDGWKKIKDITKEDYIAQWDKDIDKISYAKPLEISNHYAEKTYLFTDEGCNFSFHVSEGHRMMYQKMNDLGEWETEVSEAKYMTNEMFDGTVRFVNSAEYIEPDSIDSLAEAFFDKHKADDLNISLNGDYSNHLISSLACLKGYKVKLKYDKINDLSHIKIKKNERFTIPQSKDFKIMREMKGEQVYCVQVPTTFIVVRHNGAVAITGNCEHARSYSSIFSTLNNVQEIRDIFQWVETNEFLQKKAEMINDVYLNGSGLQKKIASVFLESFLFYSGFYTPLYYLGKSKLINVAEVIKLILRDESVFSS